MFNFLFTFLQQQSFLWPLYKSSYGQSTKNIPYEIQANMHGRCSRQPDPETPSSEISSSMSEISLSESVSYSSSYGSRTAPMTFNLTAKDHHDCMSWIHQHRKNMLKVKYFKLTQYVSPKCWIKNNNISISSDCSAHLLLQGMGSELLIYFHWLQLLF